MEDKKRERRERRGENETVCVRERERRGNKRGELQKESRNSLSLSSPLLSMDFSDFFSECVPLLALSYRREWAGKQMCWWPSHVKSTSARTCGVFQS